MEPLGHRDVQLIVSIITETREELVRMQVNGQEGGQEGTCIQLADRKDKTLAHARLSEIQWDKQEPGLQNSQLAKSQWRFDSNRELWNKRNLEDKS